MPFGSLTLNRLCAHAPSSLRPITCQLVVMPLVVAFQPAASSVLQGAFSGSAFPVLSPSFPGFFTDSTSSPKAYDFRHFLLPRPRTSHPLGAVARRPPRGGIGLSDGDGASRRAGRWG